MLDSVRPLSPVHTLLYPHLLYPLQNIALVASIYTTMLVALERYSDIGHFNLLPYTLILISIHRYIAVSRPINVFLRNEDELRWRKVWLYVGPVLAFSVLFNLPTFFHFYVTYDESEMHTGE